MVQLSMARQQLCAQSCVTCWQGFGRAEREMKLGQSWFLKYHVSRTDVRILLQKFRGHLFQGLCFGG